MKSSNNSKGNGHNLPPTVANNDGVDTSIKKRFVFINKDLFANLEHLDEDIIIKEHQK